MSAGRGGLPADVGDWPSLPALVLERRCRQGTCSSAVSPHQPRM
jgi:hypothetical protein